MFTILVYHVSVLTFAQHADGNAIILQLFGHKPNNWTNFNFSPDEVCVSPNSRTHYVITPGWVPVPDPLSCFISLKTTHVNLLVSVEQRQEGHQSQ